ncbi:MAG: ribonuclease Y [Dehalococcoidia bacterium]|jgi:ribonuclease Y|uniref:ribonuclease Y n=1 Tax=Candidatus Amarobacter glycogenicus TaxID=3140699 RepID=UPI001D65F3AA|nr:ribonuclease Y [Dehalococcoidia bacterium]MBK7125400.1 ribonuclease Y [Dehalococcoidia bacterium]MBK7725171.1 ribonuclease Y [Dehalococcoidia bacterium]MBK8558968.1 ribonuclease Y [Dehalococcoidia bacterium]MBK9343615.1 ribonuclease Y [Dehalococcoidia bacterium]
MLAIVSIIVGLAGLLIGAGAGFVLRKRSDGTSLQQAEEQASRILAEAETHQKELLLAAKEETLTLRNQLEAEMRDRRAEAARSEQRLAQKEENLDRKVDTLERREQSLRDREASIEQLRTEAEELRLRQATELERVSNLTVDEAREQLLGAIEGEIRDEASRRVREMEKEVEATAGPRARKILATAIQRYTSEVTAENTVSVVQIPSDDMKGRIIGREGRNIRAIEAATGVDLIIDDTPDAVTVSAFDPVRREVARQALSMLVQDGRIHPTRIEEAVNKARRDVEATMQDAAEAAAVEAGVLNLHPEVLKVFGRLRYRTSYGQNVMRHCIETGHIAAMIAREIGADVEVARAGGFLHDLGKAVDHEVEGTHAIIGADIARRFKVKDAIAHCIEAHHEEVEPRTVEAVIVMMADSISGGRPGARRESLEAYIKRLETLENIAKSHKGVESAFAIQAGREVRIIVRPEVIDDLEAMRIARDVSQQIEETMEYPGQIKVTVVRETRATEYAR